MKKILDRIFKWFCNPDYYDDIRGDLEELYKEKQQNSAKFHANLYYLKEILLLLRMSLARPTLFQALVNQQVLLHSNFKTAFRYMWENKAFSFIKLSGLSLGIAATLVLSIYIQQQLSFDDFYPNKDRIYRVKANYLKEGFAGVHFPAPLAPTLVKDFPEIEQAGRLIFASWLKQFRPITQTQNFYESKAAMVDPELLDILDLIIIEGGDVAKSLKEPRTVLISHTKARKFFSGTSPMGKLLVINNDTENPYQVVGVFKDFPPNSHIQLDFMVTMSGVEFWPGEKTYWGANMYSVYALLREGVSSESVNKKLGSIIENYFLQSFKEREFANPEEIANNIELGLQPLQEIYLGSSEIRDKLKHGDQSLLWLFGISAILIVMIAIINFINLSIARYSIRLKELSMRKILGATRGQLIQQFLIESLLYSFLAVLLGLTIAYLALPYFGELIGQSLIFPISILWGIPIFFLAILVLGISTGTYPAIFLSNLTPRSQNLTARKGNNVQLFQRSLVIFQFIISATLIICTIAVLKQTQFILDKDIGFDKDQIVVLKGTNSLGAKLHAFQEEIEKLAGVKEVSVSDYLPVEGSQRYMDSFWEKGKEGVEAGVNAQIWQVDQNYLNTLGINIIQGRNFAKNLNSDSTAIIISSALAEKLNSTDVLGGLITNKEKSWRVIGVIDDIHFESLKNNVTPLCLVLGESPSMMAIKTHSSNPEKLIETIEGKWAQFVPSDQFRYEFMDKSFEMMHKDVAKSGQLFNIFSILAIIIACLGLFGLSAFKANQRERELGIRKVLGANMSTIIYLLSKDYIFLILIANLIAVPLGWYIVSNILGSFAYRVEIGWQTFALAACLTVGIAIGTISYQSVKAALKNPIDAIKEV